MLYNHWVFFLGPYYYDVGGAMIECRHCKSLMWYQERMEKHKHAANPKYQLCCGNGKVELSFLKHPPTLLSYLLFDHNSKIVRISNLIYEHTTWCLCSCHPTLNWTTNSIMEEVDLQYKSKVKLATALVVYYHLKAKHQNLYNSTFLIQKMKLLIELMDYGMYINS